MNNADPQPLHLHSVSLPTPPFTFESFCFMVLIDGPGFHPLLYHVGLFQLKNLVTWTLPECFSFPEEESKGLNYGSWVPEGGSCSSEVSWRFCVSTRGGHSFHHSPKSVIHGPQH